MSRRKIIEGLPLPAFLRPTPRTGAVLEVERHRKHFGGIHAVSGATPATSSAGEIHALIGPNGAGKTTLFNLVSGLFAPGYGHACASRRARSHGCAPDRDLPARPGALVPDHQPVQGPDDLREPAAVAAGAARRALQRLARYRQLPRHPRRDRRTDAASSASRASRTIQGGDLSYGGQRLVDLGHRAGLQAAGAAARRTAGRPGRRRARAGIAT